MPNALRLTRLPFSRLARVAARTAALVLPLVAAGLPWGCASRAPGPAMAAVGTSPREALRRAKAAFLTRDWTAARDALERAQLDASTPAEVADVTTQRAALAVYAGDLATAARLLRSDLALWEPVESAPRAFDGLRALAWIDWADRRPEDALADLERAGAWLAGSALAGPERQARRRTYAWDRAYLLVDVANASPDPTPAAVTRAVAARDAYAREEGPGPALDLLDLHLVDVTRDVARTPALHARLAAATLDDVKSLYALRAAQLRDARFDDAAVTEAKIRAFPEPGLMHALVVRAMASASLDPRP